MTSLAHESRVLERPPFLWQTRDEPSIGAGGFADVAAADLQSGKALPPDAVLTAVNSLYDDELKPNLGLVRRRLKELYDVLVPITDLRKLIQGLVKAKIISVQGDPQEPVLTVHSRPEGSFIDPMDPSEPYDAAIFKRMEALMDAVAASDPKSLYKGGRYGMAQQLRSVEMPELQDFSLGQVCHIVQIAISKKIVGYKKGGALVPYKLSDSCMKNSADSSDSNSVDLLPPIKNVAELRAVLMVLWMNSENHQGVPLSLVKDKIEQATKRALSEHLLGFSKLSHLFTMPELEGCCELRHDEPFKPMLCPPAIVTGAAKPSRSAGRVPVAMADEAKPPPLPPMFPGAGASSMVPPAFPALPPALLPMPPMPPMPHWDPMLASVPCPMTIAMVKAHMESLGAGLESPLPPFGTAEVPEGLSLGPEVNFAPPSLDPHGPRDPDQQHDDELSTDFIEALLAEDNTEDNTPPPSFLADEEHRTTPRQAARVMPENIKASPNQRPVEVVGAMLESIDTAWLSSSNVGTPPLRPSPVLVPRAGR